MKNIILKETIQIFKTSDERMLLEAMERGLHNDMFNLFSEINKEIDVLPKNKRIKIKKLYLELLENEIKKERKKNEFNNN